MQINFMASTEKCFICDVKLTAEEIYHQQSLCQPCMDKAIGLTTLPLNELNALPYGVIILNEAGVITSYNDWEQQLSGKSRAEVMGKNFFTEVAPCTSVREFGGRFTEFLKSKSFVETFEFLFHFPSRPVRVNIAFVRFSEAEKFVRVLVRKRG
jgi:photoactive yellow protein